MIPLLVFSKNRAMQLDLLLRSIKKNCPVFWPYIVYKTTTPEFEQGYNKLIDKQIIPITWKKETKIDEDLIDFLTISNYNIFGLATDDCVFYRELKFSREEVEELLNDEIFTVSLRMGLNNKIQNYQTGEKQQEISFYSYESDEDLKWLHWHWKSYPAHSNPGYPMGQDGHIFKKEDFLKHLPPKFSTMREVESYMVNHRWDIMKEYMASPRRSILVNIPANNMQEPIIENKFDAFSAEELNERYLKGHVINLYEIEETDVVGAHQAINYIFDERPEEARNKIEAILDECRKWKISDEELKELES